VSGDNLIDVGQSGDLDNRLASHNRQSCWEQVTGLKYSIYVLPTVGWSREQREEVERRIRLRYNPPCGKR
jgi:hypothetical protein